MTASGRYCSLIPGLGVKLSTIILAGPTVLSAVGACPPHDGVRRRWWINVESAVTLSGARKASNDLTTATVPAGTTFPAVSRELEDTDASKVAAIKAALAAKKGARGIAYDLKVGVGTVLRLKAA